MIRTVSPGFGKVLPSPGLMVSTVTPILIAVEEKLRSVVGFAKDDAMDRANI